MVLKQLESKITGPVIARFTMARSEAGAAVDSDRRVERTARWLKLVFILNDEGDGETYSWKLISLLL